MLRRAVKENWNITPEMRELVVKTMVDVVSGSEQERSRIAASRVLLAADAINAKREATQVEEDKPIAPTPNTTINVGFFADVASYRQSFAVAAQRENQDTQDEQLTLEDLSLAGFSPPPQLEAPEDDDADDTPLEERP